MQKPNVIITPKGTSDKNEWCHDTQGNLTEYIVGFEYCGDKKPKTVRCPHCRRRVKPKTDLIDLGEAVYRVPIHKIPKTKRKR